MSDISRKGFLLGIGSTALAGVLPAAEDKCLLKVGILTDTHFGRVKEGVGRFQAAWQLFKDHGCQLLAHVGDIGDRYYPEWYAKVCDVRNELFPDPKTAPKELWVCAGHDWLNMPGGRGPTGYGNYRLLRDALKIPHEAYDRFSLAGFEFVVCPQRDDYPKMRELIDTAFARTKPGNPVFLFDHSAGFDTTEGSEGGGLGIIKKRKFLANYPQLIHISGHSHGSLYNERNIHQGEYTTVSAGCLTYFASPGIGIARSESGSGENYSVIVLELHAAYAVFRRYSILSGREIGADEPWVVDWPFDPAKAKYARSNQRRRHSAPQFPVGATLTGTVERGRIRTLAGSGEHLKLEFPATGNRFTHWYRVEAFRANAQGQREQILMRDMRGEYWKEPERRQAKLVHYLDAAYFAPGEPIEVTVRPVDFWENLGRPLVWKGTAPTDDCAEILRGEVTKTNDFCYELPPLPAEALDRDAKVVVEVESDVATSRGVFFGLSAGQRTSVDTCVTPPGHSRLTYVLRLRTKNLSAGDRIRFGFKMHDGHGDTHPFSINFLNVRLKA